MENYLHLFTSIKEALPTKSGDYCTIRNDFEGGYNIDTDFFNCEIGRFTFNYANSIDYWLDLNKITKI